MTFVLSGTTTNKIEVYNPRDSVNSPETNKVAVTLGTVGTFFMTRETALALSRLLLKVVDVNDVSTISETHTA